MNTVPAEQAHARALRELVISFVDLSFFTKDASCREETEIAETIDSYYERVGQHVATASGTVVKFIGDGALLTFPNERADDALAAMLKLRGEVDSWLGGLGWMSRLMVKMHSGPVIAGDYGVRGAKRFDVIGNTVNITARLPRPFHVTPQFFRLLSQEDDGAGRKLLKKHTPPITYIPIDDRHG